MLQDALFSHLASATWISMNCAVDMASFSYHCFHHFPEPVVFSWMSPYVCWQFPTGIRPNQAFLLISAKTLSSFQWCISAQISHLISLSGTIFNLNFQVYLMESCGDRNWGGQRNYREFPQCPRRQSNDIRYHEASQFISFITLICQQRCILVLWLWTPFIFTFLKFLILPMASKRGPYCFCSFSSITFRYSVLTVS